MTSVTAAFPSSSQPFPYAAAKASSPSAAAPGELANLPVGAVMSAAQPGGGAEQDGRGVMPPVRPGERGRAHRRQRQDR